MAVPNLADNPGTELSLIHTIPGDVRVERIGRATLYLGDCASILPMLGRVDAVVTDPPYGIGASAGTGKYGRLKVGADLDWDSTPPSDELMEAVRSAAPKALIWGMNYFRLPPTRRYIVWDKGAGFKGRDFAECELAWCSVDGNATVFLRDPLARKDYAGKEHPTQKPVAVMAHSIELLGDLETVLDPFMGAGTTGVAALLAGKSFIGIEREPTYFEIACRRLREVNGDDAGPLFGTNPPHHEAHKPADRLSDAFAVAEHVFHASGVADV